MYTGVEGNDVSVCVVLLSPTRLARQVVPEVSSEDMSATGTT